MKVAHVTTVGVSLYGLLLNQMRSLRARGLRDCGYLFAEFLCGGNRSGGDSPHRSSY